MKERRKKLTRREFLQGAAVATAGMIVVGCGTPTPQIIKETVEVEKEVVKIVEGTPVVEKVIETQVIEKVVTATPEPVVKEEAPAVLGTFPRSETLIARILTGRVGTPDNFNWWVGWKSSDRGIQNVADEALWSVDFATGEIINGLAESDPIYNADFTECTIPLRKGVAWADGEPFSAADVVYSIETFKAYDQLGAHNY
ncbi:MAG: twin-arginine translocation signal domain-containing protein, partial [Anaerolineae bacterium]|nr:twin-arginine translocation signal domain-containing protein [Anaerolineae bacterium]